ncbi:MAG: AbrB/MazE/SpoVT family DNA-binding domain-containing protein [Candidatus Caldatribacteriota bacterium]|nr:AbrB/MazE/SpoVT family DNA-binding domain-containing protein [Atribacterota bacterium]MDD3641590.1 AbrB/MazE/SpoVT family DNA-binding domain-containing protein [Atribacterota bacterium]MDD4289520.1 AbrB/MazE/SpoVT family DNA-binding domain-containing protein [Atribacterota bacterium]MDD4765730.1 AbrB/MazE/SpoVT family DNA-binding domain-containing protein [Atribacterota bacterium]MDD5635769.1 AbrB/MazE/SpoVT family DNA-binding domain-containing protein [Atribacterota bacterium]
MKATIIPIGNSKGLRIPKAILEQCNILEEVSLEVRGDSITIKPIKNKPRKDWHKYFKIMKKKEEDKLLINEKIDLEMEDWEW